MLSAPMLYESKMDGSLAAHATQVRPTPASCRHPTPGSPGPVPTALQTNLRLVKDDSPQGITVHHDHSLRRALNRGNDFKEGPQVHEPSTCPARASPFTFPSPTDPTRPHRPSLWRTTAS